jgi:hypothetical protein
VRALRKTRGHIDGMTFHALRCVMHSHASPIAEAIEDLASAKVAAAAAATSTSATSSSTSSPAPALPPKGKHGRSVSTPPAMHASLPAPAATTAVTTSASARAPVALDADALQRDAQLAAAEASVKHMCVRVVSRACDDELSHSYAQRKAALLERARSTDMPLQQFVQRFEVCVVVWTDRELEARAQRCNSTKHSSLRLHWRASDTNDSSRPCRCVMCRTARWVVFCDSWR